ncbi:TetR/AcrR family transcriptional regulator [Paenibacillus sp. 481]|uniref:TetR/AcrR family transcriptional regulator n=1 Tax=Paenibacillus sp. 481 TaxID=2835869 RepID=UPI001E4E69D1|nr:TetR/AcrR family transcriptional regulator [Paenibacillus sp. 481]UHA75543.1 TetR/AcrR family transcriptional regulator [Paenibacillus sp. 481]
MSQRAEKTADKILEAAIELICEHGYQAVTTKSIAQAAGVSEMTVFRIFGTKKGILEAAIDKYSYSVPMTHAFEECIKWNLEADLFMVSKLYHDLMRKNRKVFVISMMERNTMPELFTQSTAHPRKLKELLTDYFAEMQRRGLVVAGDPEHQSITFLYMNHGKYVSETFTGGLVSSIQLDDWLPDAIRVLARGLTP